jgi:ribosomal protein S18 acetylase RimI-like enzyme
MPRGSRAVRCAGKAVSDNAADDPVNATLKGAESAESTDTLSYELLLLKSCETSAASDVAADSVSTVEPASSSASTVGSMTAACGTAPSRDRVQLLRNVPLYDPQADERIRALISQTRELSQTVFEEDCLQEVTKKSGWKLSLLVSDDLTVLCGFVVARMTKGTLSIAKLAVPSHFRGLGFGKLVMDELTKVAKKQGDVYDICLSSLPTAVSFYQRLGFKAFRGLKMAAAGEEEDLVEGQVYMEKRLRKPPRK